MSEMLESKQIPCPKCGKNFVCGVSNGGDTCWCVELPPRYEIQKDRCVCSDCFKKQFSLP
jgi:hypothetical protein